MMRTFLAFCLVLSGQGSTAHAQKANPGEARRPADDAELAYWLRNMLEDHRFTPEEASAATGLTVDEVAKGAERIGIHPGQTPRSTQGTPLRVLPYPGGRHPRIGFLDGAVDPQRETKFSVFTPWDPSSYVVVDFPEALWSNLGLTYLAHTHVPTVWSKQGVTLPKQEWTREGNRLHAVRTLPNGIRFEAKVQPTPTAVRMSLTLTNGTNKPLTDLRVQQCVMLKGAAGFAAQTNDNKVFRAPYVAVRNDAGDRWIITAWTSCHRAWGNAPCPCLHSDPKFPDCPPGRTETLRGWLSFYEGKDLEAELRRIDLLDWQNEAVP